ncbi:hypothetical protein ACWDG9_36300 [Streptomyces sp. NPDC001073]
MEPSTSLPETLRRLDELITERGLKRGEVLHVQTLAAKTALPDTVVRRLLKGGKPTPDKVSDRVCARMKVVSDAYLADSGKKMQKLAEDLRDLLGISDVWARSVCEGKRMPNVDLLHHLAEYFHTEGGERFFTAPADEALNRALLPILRELEGSDTDALSQLMREYGVESAHMRQDGDLTREQLERVLKGVLQSVLPQKGESGT